MNPDQLLKKTSERFPHFKTGVLHLIDEGGSDRQFYRCQNEVGESLIVVHYNKEKAENNFYAEHALFLKNQDIRVPAVLAHAGEEGLLWLQDLGKKNLWSIRAASWEIRRPLYQLALKEIAKLHRLPLDAALEKKLSLQSAFDEELYRWEQNYFLEYALGSLFKIDLKKREQLASSTALQELAQTLATYPRQLVHRDFQSQNILFFEEQICLIDFQGMRAGLAPYDVASLLCDPYVTFSHSERQELLAFYQQEMKEHHFSFSFDFEKTFWECAVQRLMQALGCYGFLGLHRGKPHFLQHAPTALQGLRHAVAQLTPASAWKELAETLAGLSF